MKGLNANFPHIKKPQIKTPGVYGNEIKQSVNGKQDKNNVLSGSYKPAIITTDGLSTSLEGAGHKRTLSYQPDQELKNLQKQLKNEAPTSSRYELINRKNLVDQEP